MKFAPVSMVAILLAAAMAGGCGGQSSAAPKQGSSVGSHASRPPVAASALLVSEPGQPGPTWIPVASIGGQPAAWIAQRSGVTLLRFDQQLVHLALHAGSSEPGGQGWTYSVRISTS
jgi:hypothetical protein